MTTIRVWLHTLISERCNLGARLCIAPLELPIPEAWHDLPTNVVIVSSRSIVGNQCHHGRYQPTVDNDRLTVHPKCAECGRVLSSIIIRTVTKTVLLLVVQLLQPSTAYRLRRLLWFCQSEWCSSSNKR